MYQQKNSTNKAQEEIVGFALVVLVVAVIFVIFIGISLRQSGPIESVETVEVSHFLDTMLAFKTDCAIGYEPAYDKLSELILHCHQGKLCTSGKTACDVLDETAEKILAASWKLSSESSIDGYEFVPKYNSVSFEDAKGPTAIFLSNCEQYEQVKVEKPLGNDLSVSFMICKNLKSNQ